MALVLITHNMGVVAETARAHHGDVCGPDHGGARGRRPLRQPAASLYGGPPGRPAGAQRRQGGSRRSRASCPGSTTVRKAACSARAAPTRPSIRRTVRPELRAWAGGQIRCHYPLGRSRTGDARRSTAGHAPSARRPRHERPRHRGQATSSGSTRSGAACSGSPRSCRRWAASRSPSSPARRWRWWANRAAGNPPSPAWSTLIEKPTEGSLHLDGMDAVHPPAGQARHLRRTVQLVFQNPYGSLNPRKRVGSILEEPLVINTDPVGGRAHGAGAGHDGEGGPAARALQPLSAHVLRRPAPAHRHRARADALARSSWWPTSRSRRSTCRSRRRS